MSSMAKRTTRQELVDRWRGIEEDLEEHHIHPLKRRTLRQLKEQWFSDAFGFLMSAPEDVHLWCGFWDLMGPLLETFHGYLEEVKKGAGDSPLERLWKRASQEMRRCTQCICQHRQAQDTYRAEYETEAVEPLMRVLQALDKERVLGHLQEMNAVIAGNGYDPDLQGSQVVSILFEILTFPVLLEDQLVTSEFESFIEAIDNSHELSLAGDQQYPGVYALLFLRYAKARAIGLRLARSMGKLRRAADLEPLQPLLSKYIGILETEVLPSNSDSSRPRIQLERITVWLGLKALLAFLEAAAFEEGILERYPIFLSIVLNHVSDDTPEFSYAVTCLRLFFQMLGCKLWLRTTLSPSMMRNTLLGQCFHTRNEKSHKEIFHLFLPFLQSLEALQDGEYEKQRRHFLYFLLHQVTKSSNFSFLMRKSACKIALLIVQRGYQMNPPCPPFECSHMWGPSLVACLKDSSLHSSLRQPAFDLIEAIIVSDCAALVSLKLRTYANSSDVKEFSCDPFNDEDEVSVSYEDKESENSFWTSVNFQSKLAARECKDWRCIPMLWLDTFVQLDPSLLPISFSKAVLWALSHVSIVVSDSSIAMKLPVSDWLTSEAAGISSSFGWEVPKGSDDGEDGNESKNSVKAFFMCLPLIRTLKRCTAHFFTSVQQQGCQTLWTWESKMAESLILLLIDPDDALRQVNRLVLEHVSKTRGLTPGLQFLCCNPDSLSAVNLGLRYAIKQAQLDPDLKSFPSFHHLFFVVRKLLKEAAPKEKSLAASESFSYSNLDGGFLRQPHCNRSSLESLESSSPEVDAKSWNRFCCLLSDSIWPFLLKCLKEGKKYIHDRGSQMTCVRLLETLPVIFESIVSVRSPITHDSVIAASVYSDLNWLFDLVEWGRSSLAVVLRHWKQNTTSLINLLEGYLCFSGRDALIDMHKTISCDAVAVDELKEQLFQCLTSLSKKDFHAKDRSLFEDKDLLAESSYLDRKKVLAAEIPLATCEDTAIHTMDSVAPATLSEKIRKDVVIISDDEDENKSSSVPVLSKSPISSRETIKEVSGELHVQAQEQLSNLIVNKKIDLLPLCKDAKSRSAAPQKELDKTLQSLKKLSSANKRSESAVESKCYAERQGEKDIQDGKCCLPGSNQVQVNDKVEMVNETMNDPLEEALNFASFSRMILNKPSISVPKRKVIQLQMPTGERSGYPNRLHADKRRHRPPKLDDWYRPILEFDYFSVAGLSSENEDRVMTSSHLREVPLCFKSPEHYVEIFRPLVLEEFKAQLHNSYVEASSSDDICCFRLCVLSVERIDDFHLVRGSPEECESLASRGCSENDLILLTKEPLQKFSHSVHALGKVERREINSKRKSLILTFRFYLQSASLHLIKIRRLLMERSKWYVNHIMSMTPQLREFQVLSSLNDIPLMPVVLNPVDFSPKYTDLPKIELAKLAQPLRHSLKSLFNDSQLQAVSAAIGNEGFLKANELSLIQGPPGTGKTRTIVAIISALLALNSSKGGNASRIQNRSSRLDSGKCSNVNAAACQAAAVARAWQDAALAKQLIQEDKLHSGSTSCIVKGRILVCAQSNAAVDELVARINCGIYGNDGKMYKPYLVRVGNVRTVHPSSLPFFIDTLVQQQLEENMNKSDSVKTDVGENPSMVLRAKLEKIVDNIRLLESIRAKQRDSEMEMRDSSEERTPIVVDGKEISDSLMGPKLNRLYAQKKAIYADLAAAQASEKKNSEEIKLLRIKIRRSILREAEIVVATLSSCGGDIYGVCSEDASDSRLAKFSEYSLFDAVVIDEAAQALEPATLIPLQLLKSSGTKCIMVGDPKQLPATVLSNVASKFFYECSMFERLQRAGYPVTMLAQQYRMHPEICRFPSLHFYDKKLVNGEMSRKSAPFHENKYFGPYVFYDIVDGHEQTGKSTGSLSLCNEAEAEAAVELLKVLTKRYPSVFTAGRIGVVTPYKRQLSVLRFRFSNEFRPDIIANMEFNTVDGFQGREVDILLLSTVRASEPNVRETGIKSRNIGFVADARRMNVALTRAKLSLWILGNARTLQINAHWSDLIQDAKARDLLVSVAGPYRVSFKKLLSSLEHPNLGENLHGDRFANHHKSKPIKAKAEKQSYRSEYELGMEQEIISDNVILSNRHVSESQKSSISLEHTSGGRLVANQRTDDKQKNHDNGPSNKHSTNAKTSFCSEESKLIKSHAQLEKNPTKKTKTKHMDDVPRTSEDCLSRYSSQSRPGSNWQQEKVPVNDNKVGDIDAKSVHLSLSRKRQREAVDAILSSSLISSKKNSSQKPLGSAAVKKNLLPSTSAKVNIRSPKKDRS